MPRSTENRFWSFLGDTGKTGSASCLRGVFILVAFLGMWGAAAATETGGEYGQQTATMDPAYFDIPAQALEDALMAYADATGVEVFVDHALAAGQQSSPVKGKYDVEGALRGLLAGTGLDLRRAADHAYTLVASPPLDPPVNRKPSWSGDNERRKFFTALQTAIKRTLCASPETLPGQYRVAVAIWFGSGGQVADARVLSADRRMKAPPELAEGIRRISVGLPPPDDLDQPVTFVILPRSADRTGDCALPGSGRG